MCLYILVFAFKIKILYSSKSRIFNESISLLLYELALEFLFTLHPYQSAIDFISCCYDLFMLHCAY